MTKDGTKTVTFAIKVADTHLYEFSVQMPPVADRRSVGSIEAENTSNATFTLNGAAKGLLSLLGALGHVWQHPEETDDRSIEFSTDPYPRQFGALVRISTNRKSAKNGRKQPAD